MSNNFQKKYFSPVSRSFGSDWIDRTHAHTHKSAPCPIPFGPIINNMFLTFALLSHTLTKHQYNRILWISNITFRSWVNRSNDSHLHRTIWMVMIMHRLRFACAPITLLIQCCVCSKIWMWTKRLSWFFGSWIREIVVDSCMVHGLGVYKHIQGCKKSE